MSSSIHFVSHQISHSEQQNKYPRDKTALFRDSAVFFERRGGEKWILKERSFRFTLVGWCSHLDIQTAVEDNGRYDLLHGMYVLCLTLANGMNGESPSSLGNSLVQQRYCSCPRNATSWIMSTRGGRGRLQVLLHRTPRRPARSSWYRLWSQNDITVTYGVTAAWYFAMYHDNAPSTWTWS